MISQNLKRNNMTKQHYVFAADKIVEDCINYGYKKENSMKYKIFVEFFSSFSEKFDIDTFDKYIDKWINCNS